MKKSRKRPSRLQLKREALLQLRDLLLIQGGATNSSDAFASCPIQQCPLG